MPNKLSRSLREVSCFTERYHLNLYLRTKDVLYKAVEVGDSYSEHAVVQLLYTVEFRVYNKRRDLI